LFHLPEHQVIITAVTAITIIITVIMPSLRSLLLAIATVLSPVARASVYWFKIDSVPRGIRTWWCESQVTICPAICAQYPDGTTEVNTCDPDTLIYGCRCGSGVKPDMNDYTLTMQYFACTEWNVECVRRCRVDNDCVRECLNSNRCGTNLPGYS